jgi:hypothetical protein
VFHRSELLSHISIQVSDNNARPDAPEHVKFPTQPELEDLNEAHEQQTSELEMTLECCPRGAHGTVYEEWLKMEKGRFTEIPQGSIGQYCVLS